MFSSKVAWTVIKWMQSKWLRMLRGKEDKVGPALVSVVAFTQVSLVLYLESTSFPCSFGSLLIQKLFYMLGVQFPSLALLVSSIAAWLASTPFSYPKSVIAFAVYSGLDGPSLVQLSSGVMDLLPSLLVTMS